MASSRSSSQSSTTKRITTTIHDELTWGVIYRSQRERNHEIPLKLACSPISVQQCSMDKIEKRVCIHPPPEEQPSKVKTRCRKKIKCVNTTNLHAGPVDLLSRSVLNQKDYMNLLSVPAIRCFNKPTRRRRKRKCVHRCSPRLVKLAIPTKTNVLATWKNHEYYLPSEFIQRLHNMLHDDNNISVKDARYYFKRCDRRRKRLKIALKKKKRRRETCDMMWMNCQVRTMARLIVNYFIDERLLELSFKQLLISSTLANFMGRTGKIRRPLKRSGKNPYFLTIIEICDKLAVWMDNAMKLVDFQPIDDDEEEELPEKEDWSEVEEEQEEENEGEELYRDMNYEDEEEEDVDEEDDIEE